MENKFYFIKKKKIISILKTVYDPEITINIYDMGLIYDININKTVKIVMTFTTPYCPEGENLMKEIKNKLINIKDIKEINIIITFDPSWNKQLISNEAKFELGIL
jgi:metal-sulfur cluster biosynthetic enzyme